MRKLIVPVLLIVFAALSLVPSMAQDAPGTIADIVVASASAETPEFATLLAAVSAADPAVLEALSNPEASLTVFAPTDAAFAALAEALGAEAFAGVLADQAALTGILLYHVLDGAVASTDVVAALEASEGFFTVPTLNGQYLDVSADEEGIFIDDAGLILEMVDIQASNGIIHVIDAVLLPETRTLAEVVVDAASDEEAPEFTTLLAAVGLADPAVLEALSDPEAELTVFAPTDAAFAALAEALGEEAFNGVLADPATLTSILLYHVVEGKVYSLDIADLLMGDMDMEATPEADMMMEPLMVPTLNGASVTVTASEMGVMVDAANVVVTDVDAANGVIHVIDAVLVPAAGE